MLATTNWPTERIAVGNVLAILFLNAGRRVELIRTFRTAFDVLGVKGRIVTTDIQELAPALHESDVSCLLPHSSDPQFVDRLSDLCLREQVKLIIPLIDPDLAVLANHKGQIEAAGARVLVSPPDTVAMCGDKLRTAAFLTEHGIPAPKILSLDQARAYPDALILKPRHGSASDNVMKVVTSEALEYFFRALPDPLIQEFVAGDEYTVDVFSDSTGEPLIAVPRRRLKVRSGEVSISRVHCDDDLEHLAMHVTRTLGTIGPANVQIIRSTRGDKVIEINPRFGGGCPLSIAAGAPFADWTLRMALGLPLQPPPTRLRDRYTMMRFDQSLFLDSESVSA